MRDWFSEDYLPTLSISDLYALFQFISADYHKHGNPKEKRNLIEERFNAVKNELQLRAYSPKPYVTSPTNIKMQGQKPEDIDLSAFDER